MPRQPALQERSVVLKVRVPEHVADQLRAQSLGLGVDTSALCAEYLATYPFTFALVPVRSSTIQAAPAPAPAPPLTVRDLQEDQERRQEQRRLQAAREVQDQHRRDGRQVG